MRGGRAGFGIAVFAAALGLALLPAAPARADDAATYDGFGFSFYVHGSLSEIARRGTGHVDASGRIVLFRYDGAWQDRTVYDSIYDDRNVAGGVTPSGRIVAFFGRYDMLRHWVDMGYISSADDGVTWSDYATVPSTGLVSFSPYGPITALPNGDLMQMFYGNNGVSYSVWALFSNDDGVTWDWPSIVVRTTRFNPTEAAVVVTAGPRLVAVIRTASVAGKRSTVGLLQMTSSDGGRHWRRGGFLTISRKVSDVSPWLVMQPSGAVALYFADRSTMTLRMAQAEPGDVFRSYRSWGNSENVYRSRAADATAPDTANFGYPSVAAMGSTRYVVMYDQRSVDPGAGVGLERIAA